MNKPISHKDYTHTIAYEYVDSWLFYAKRLKRVVGIFDKRGKEVFVGKDVTDQFTNAELIEMKGIINEFES